MPADLPSLSSAAFLVMDYQPIVLGRITEADSLVSGVANLLAKVRGAGRPVIFVRVAFRPGHPEISERNPTFAEIKAAGRLVMGEEVVQVDPRLSPRDDEVVVIKHRVGAFPGTDLDMVLRAKGIDTLVLMGVSTSGVVLSTLRHAADADYRLVVVRDGCADHDAEVHRVLMDKVFPRQASVVDAAEVAGAL